MESRYPVNGVQENSAANAQNTNQSSTLQSALNSGQQIVPPITIMPTRALDAKDQDSPSSPQSNEESAEDKEPDFPAPVADRRGTRVTRSDEQKQSLIELTATPIVSSSSSPSPTQTNPEEKVSDVQAIFNLTPEQAYQALSAYCHGSKEQESEKNHRIQNFVAHEIREAFFRGTLPESMQQQEEAKSLIARYGQVKAEWEQTLKEINRDLIKSKDIEVEDKSFEWLLHYYGWLSKNGTRGYGLELMSELPLKNKSQAEPNTIYISADDRTYVVRDPQGVVQTGSLPKDIDLSNLPKYRNDTDLTNQIIKVTSKAGHTDASNNKASKEYKQLMGLESFKRHEQDLAHLTETQLSTEYSTLMSEWSAVLQKASLKIRAEQKSAQEPQSAPVTNADGTQLQPLVKHPASIVIPVYYSPDEIEDYFKENEKREKAASKDSYVRDALYTEFLNLKDTRERVEKEIKLHTKNMGDEAGPREQYVKSLNEKLKSECVFEVDLSGNELLMHFQRLYFEERVKVSGRTTQTGYARKGTPATDKRYQKLIAAKRKLDQIEMQLDDYCYSSQRQQEFLTERFRKQGQLDLLTEDRGRPVDDLEEYMIQQGLLKRYELRLLSELPDGDTIQALPNRIYLTADNRTYVVRDLNGEVQAGFLPRGINLSDLPNRLNDPYLKKQIITVTSKAGYTRLKTAKKAIPSMLDALAEHCEKTICVWSRTQEGQQELHPVHNYVPTQSSGEVIHVLREGNRYRQLNEGKDADREIELGSVVEGQGEERRERKLLHRFKTHTYQDKQGQRYYKKYDIQEESQYEPYKVDPAYSDMCRWRDRFFWEAVIAINQALKKDRGNDGDDALHLLEILLGDNAKKAQEGYQQIYQAALFESLYQEIFLKLITKIKVVLMSNEEPLPTQLSVSARNKVLNELTHVINTATTLLLPELKQRMEQVITGLKMDVYYPLSEATKNTNVAHAIAEQHVERLKHWALNFLQGNANNNPQAAYVTKFKTTGDLDDFTKSMSRCLDSTKNDVAMLETTVRSHSDLSRDGAISATQDYLAESREWASQKTKLLPFYYQGHGPHARSPRRMVDDLQATHIGALSLAHIALEDTGDTLMHFALLAYNKVQGKQKERLFKIIAVLFARGADSNVKNTHNSPQTARQLARLKLTVPVLEFVALELEHQTHHNAFEIEVARKLKQYCEETHSRFLGRGFLERLLFTFKKSAKELQKQRVQDVQIITAILYEARQKLDDGQLNKLLQFMLEDEETRFVHGGELQKRIQSTVNTVNSAGCILTYFGSLIQPKVEVTRQAVGDAENNEQEKEEAAEEEKHITGKEKQITAKEIQITAKEKQITAKEIQITAKEIQITAETRKISDHVRERLTSIQQQWEEAKKTGEEMDRVITRMSTSRKLTECEQQVLSKMISDRNGFFDGANKLRSFAEQRARSIANSTATEGRSAPRFFNNRSSSSDNITDRPDESSALRGGAHQTENSTPELK